MPTPGKGESQQDFVSRCIPMVLQEGTTDKQDQAAAICYSMYRRAKTGGKQAAQTRTPVQTPQMT